MTSMEESAYPPLPEPLERGTLRRDVERVGVATEATPSAAAAAATPAPRQPAARRQGLHPDPCSLAREAPAKTLNPGAANARHRLRTPVMGRLPHTAQQACRRLPARGVSRLCLLCLDCGGGLQFYFWNGLEP
jgi:hypothetical protein